jgi:DNA-directed RNA polymerase specialized sigma24 family protein
LTKAERNFVRQHAPRYAEQFLGRPPKKPAPWLIRIANRLLRRKVRSC